MIVIEQETEVKQLTISIKIRVTVLYHNLIGYIPTPSLDIHAGLLSSAITITRM